MFYGFSPRFRGKEDIRPQPAGFAQGVSQAQVGHAGVGATGECLELGDEIFKPEGFACGLGAAGFEHGVYDMDVEMVVGWLI